MATRESVLLAGARVFERYGYAAATIALILEEAAVTKGAMYFHFDSKESLADAIVAEQSNWREVNTETGACPFQRAVDLSYRFVAALREDPLVRASIRLTLERNTFGDHVDAAPYRDWLDAVLELMRESSDHGELIVEPGAAAYVVVSIVTGVQLVSQALTAREDLAQRLYQIWSVIAPALVTPETLRKLDLSGLSVAS